MVYLIIASVVPFIIGMVVGHCTCETKWANNSDHIYLMHFDRKAYKVVHVDDVDSWKRAEAYKEK